MPVSKQKVPKEAPEQLLDLVELEMMGEKNTNNTELDLPGSKVYQPYFPMHKKELWKVDNIPEE